MELFKLPENSKKIDTVPKFCTASVLGCLLDLSKKRIANLKSEGVFAENGRDTYDIEECCRTYVKKLRTGKSSRKHQIDSEKLEKLKRENLEAENELIRIEDVILSVQKIGSILNEQLEALAPRLALDVSNCDSVAEIQATITEETRRSREVITSAIKSFLESYDKED